MRLTLIAVGKLKDPGLTALCEGYQRRLRPYMPLEQHECRDRDALRERRRRGVGLHIYLDERGDTPSTLELAAWLRAWQAEGIRDLSFYIGDADGFDDDDRGAADRLLALSRLTLPHRLARLLLLEQLYRVATHLAGHPYHHI
jgi:23S rRNA (pseudouridine1915-N3)-methyltransferase